MLTYTKILAITWLFCKFEQTTLTSKHDEICWFKNVWIFGQPCMWHHFTRDIPNSLANVNVFIGNKPLCQTWFWTTQREIQNIYMCAFNFFLLSSITVSPCNTRTVDLSFCITNCRFLLAIVFRTWDLVCINLSFASKEFVCARSTEFAQSPRLALHSKFCLSAWTSRYGVEFCIASARIRLAVPAVAPW